MGAIGYLNRMKRRYFPWVSILTGFIFWSVSCSTPDKDQITVAGGTFKSWAPTPPMGWNSWDCYGPTVREEEVIANADYMAANLASFGWQYIVVDIRWFVENTKAGGYNQTDPRYVVDDYGRYLPAVNRFPTAADGQGFTNLAGYIHDKGLKFGIHIMRGVPKIAVEEKMPILGTEGITADQIYSPEMQCEWLRDNYTIVASQPGAQEYYNSIFNLYAQWGVDFVKVDDIARPYHQEEIELIRHAIDQCGRPIVLSLSPGATPLTAAEHVRNHANMWRMVDDVWDTWPHILHLMDVAPPWYPYIEPGTWPDCDMIPLGRISIRGERGPDRQTRLTPDEQNTLMTLFTISKSPLFFGGDLPSNDPFTISLLTNEAVLKMHRECTGVRKLSGQDSTLVISARNPNDNTYYLALFNLSGTENVVQADLSLAGMADSCHITNLWTGEDIGMWATTYEESLAPHASGLYQLTPSDH